jgi:hypothetical protein
MRDAEKVKQRLNAKKPEETLDWSKGLSIGFTLGNLALTGRPDVAFLPGYYYLIVGDTDSGKTYIALSILAEASINPVFSKYRLIYNAVERGALMSIRQHFGQALSDRLEPPRKDKDGHPEHSSSIEDFFYHVSDLLDDGRPFIEVLDSMDALSSDPEASKFQEQKKAWEKGKEVAGSYGDGKAKKNSSGIRQLVSRLEKTESVLAIISQTRDNIGFGSQFEPKTMAGGNALKFYATAQLWTSVKERLKREVVKGKNLDIGIKSRVRVKRSRFTGWPMAVDVPIYWSAGLDDVGSCVEFLLEWKHWEKESNRVVAPEFDFKGYQEDLVKYIQTNDLEQDLRGVVAGVWGKLADKCRVERKRRYE